MEPGEVKKRYEWISTSRLGRVETYLAEDENNNTYFESGRVVPTSDIQNLLKEIDEETFNYKNSQQPEIESPKTVDHFIEMEKLLGNEPQPAQHIAQVVEQNPIKIILDKQKKKETVTLLVDFDFEIPTKKVLELLDLMFDREEVIDEIIKSSTEKINIESITEAVKTSIKEKISSYFEEEVEKDDIKNEKPTSR
jgi:hypothetical protein